MKAYLILEDGTVFEGVHFGADRNVISEIVFNTSMAGYVEVLTDPSYAGQAVCMTYPLIGNYGVCLEDLESERPWVDGFIVKELSGVASNFRSDLTIQEFIDRYEIPGIQGIDTRALTKLLRDKGTMNGMITTSLPADMEATKKELSAYRTGDVVRRVTCSEKYTAGEGSLKVALMDFGVKKNIIRSLVKRGCSVTVYPAATPAGEVLEDRPDGILLSNGPGDPKDCGEIIDEVRTLCASGIPLFAICLGHQLAALARGGDTHRLKYGHRGGNHPVRDLATGRVYISSQNHGYVVDASAMPEGVCRSAFENVNDGTNEGFEYLDADMFTVQFHPEASPGPQDTGYLFDRFIQMMKNRGE